jgi:hypothetical protein
MTQCHWLALPLALLAGTVFCAAAAAQPSPRDARMPAPASSSHAPIRSSVDPQQLRLFLQQRLGMTDDPDDLEKLLQDKDLQNLLQKIWDDPDKYGLKEQLDKFGTQGERKGKAPPMPDLNDQKWRDLLEKAFEKPGDLGKGTGVSPEKIDQWKKWLDNQKGGTEPSSTLPLPHDLGPESKEKSGKEHGPDATPKALDPPGTKSDPPQLITPPAPTPQQPLLQPDKEQSAKLSNGLLDFFKERLGPDGDMPLSKSPALKQFLEELKNTPLDRPHQQGLGLAEPTKGLAEKMPALKDYLQFDKLQFKGDHSGWNKPLLSFTPGHNSGGGPSWKPTGGSGGSLLAMGGPGADGAVLAEAVLWVAFLVVVGVVLVTVLLWWRKMQAGKDENGRWRLGAWPVNPAAVRTRQDVVRAFEYLSLLVLGRPAESWHHLAIAGRLGGAEASAERDRAARQLAALYEQARYAPPDEVLPEAELATARNALSFLAGAATA